MREVGDTSTSKQRQEQAAGQGGETGRGRRGRRGGSHDELLVDADVQGHGDLES